jgi:pimeloyl-ACP methyl ester carboxylesterase
MTMLRPSGLVLVVLLLTGCGSSTPSASTPVSTAAEASAPAASVGPTFKPTFAQIPCPDDVRAVVVVAPSCGYLTVLEDRSKPDGRTIRVFVAKIEPPGGTTTADPLLLLGESLAAQVEYGGVAPGATRTHRNLYVVDMRGIGHSEPNLDCPEVRAAGPILAGLPLGDQAHRTTLIAAVQGCHDRLTGSGVDLAAYDLAADAADLEDLRLALGVDRWDVGANGSASRIGFEMAARYPHSIRAMYADSPSLPAPDQLTVGPAAFDSALARLAAACSAEPRCSRQMPDLPAAVDEAVAKLDKHPLSFDVAGVPAATQIGHPIRVVVDGAALLRWIRASLSSDGGNNAGFVVRDVLRVLDGQVTATDPLVLALGSDPGDCLGLYTGCQRMTFGALYSIVCRDVGPSVDRAAVDQAVRGRPAWAQLFDPAVVLAPCDAWSVGPRATGQTPGSPTAGVRSLLMSGALDPFTIPSAQLAAATADDPNATVLEIPNQSYNVLGYTECPRTIRNVWLDLASGPPPDTSCLGQIGPINLKP